MSYDLLFYASPGDRLDQQAIADHIARLPGADGAATPVPLEAPYENPDTQVHFHLEFDQSHYYETEDPQFAYGAPAAIVRVNFLRPTFFILEAAKVAADLVRQFDFLVLDPQEDDLAPSEYDPRRLIETYRNHAARAMRAFLDGVAGRGEKLADYRIGPPLPRALLDAAWAWNMGRAEIQESCGPDLYAPVICALQHEETTGTFVFWGDGVPMLLPPTDFIILGREVRSKKFGVFSRSREYIELLTASEFESDFGAFYEADVDHPGGLRALPESWDNVKAAIEVRPLEKAYANDGAPRPFQVMNWQYVIDAELFRD